MSSKSLHYDIDAVVCRVCACQIGTIKSQSESGRRRSLAARAGNKRSLCRSWRVDFLRRVGGPDGSQRVHFLPDARQRAAYQIILIILSQSQITLNLRSRRVQRASPVTLRGRVPLTACLPQVNMRPFQLRIRPDFECPKNGGAWAQVGAVGQLRHRKGVVGALGMCNTVRGPLTRHISLQHI